MRIVSQDGRIDLPYEQIVVATSNTDRTRIIAFPVNVSEESYCCFAKYSTEEKAVKAMEMLRTKYENYKQVRSSEYYFAFDYPKVFRFPQDSEV